MFLGGVVILGILVFYGVFFYFRDNSELDTGGIYPKVEVGSLSFQLNDIELYKGYSTPESSNYNLWWRFIVTNDGQSIERVSDCGVLLFEDGSQYKTTNRECNYHEMVPGARITLWSNFYFSNPQIWEDIPGSKVTYFSQQSEGLVKYTIYKREIRSTE